jgi:four helix bundle protein
MNSHTELTVWKKGMDLVMFVYTATSKFPDDERFNLTSQIRRSAVSIPSNVAEGYGRRSKKEFAQFLRIAYGSSAELETQLEIAYRLRILSADEHRVLNELLTEVRKMINKLLSYLSTKN